MYDLELEVVNRAVDPTFGFMRLDHDGKIRMDCSSPHAMAGLIGLKGRFDIAFGNDPDFDRHGIVTRSGGLMNPNHYLAVAVWHLFSHRPHWPAAASVGKTLVSSSMIDRVAARLGRGVTEVPVGFKWFVDGLLSGACAFACEESAGAAFLRRDGTVWVTDKDGIIMDLLAAEITAVHGKDPGECYRALEREHGRAWYARIDAAASKAQRDTLARLSPSQVTATELAGDPIIAKLTRAPGNDAPIGGLKVTTAHGWFAARPSGTEDIYKVYAESFRGEEHLRRIQQEAQAIVAAAWRLIAAPAARDRAGRQRETRNAGSGRTEPAAPPCPVRVVPLVEGDRVGCARHRSRTCHHHVIPAAISWTASGVETDLVRVACSGRQGQGDRRLRPAVEPRSASRCAPWFVPMEPFLSV